MNKRSDCWMYLFMEGIEGKIEFETVVTLDLDLEAKTVVGIDILLTGLGRRIVIPTSWDVQC
jgi:hypothetical protein